jgi:DNA-binding NtrC family response regulator
MESELFGYVKGAFTDAKRDKPGRIAQADGGTLFLDEVGDLPLQVQVKLLRFLQERAYEPLGATFTTRADVRVISATHRDLGEMVAEGSFRQDLFYRLNVMEIGLPPLRERGEDVPLLVEHFIQRFRGITGKKIQRIDDRALAVMMRYSFPGNIRELENLVERAFILCQGPTIMMEHLPAEVRKLAQANGAPGNGSSPANGVASRGAVASTALADPLQKAEREAISVALRRNRGNRTRAATELGIHRSTLIRKIKRYGLGD